jgi:hypothetical protein
VLSCLLQLRGRTVYGCCSSTRCANKWWLCKHAGCEMCLHRQRIGRARENAPNQRTWDGSAGTLVKRGGGFQTELCQGWVEGGFNMGLCCDALHLQVPQGPEDFLLQPLLVATGNTACGIPRRCQLVIRDQAQHAGMWLRVRFASCRC